MNILNNDIVNIGQTHVYDFYDSLIWSIALIKKPSNNTYLKLHSLLCKVKIY